MSVPRRGVFWPLLLIALGLIFLLANYGFIAPITVLGLVSLWPLLLILLGIDLAIGRRWPVAAIAIDVAVIALGLAFVATQPAFPGFFVGYAVTRDGGSADVSVPRDGARSLTLHLNGGAGRYQLSGGSGGLVDAHSDRNDLQVRSSVRANGVDVRLDQSPFGRGGPAFSFGNNASTIEVHVASDIATSLDVNGGAGQFTLDLRDVRVTDARVNAGAGQLMLLLPNASGDVAIRINSGAGSVVIEIPAGVEARVTMTGGLGSLRSTNPRTGPGGGGCFGCAATVETNGYATAKDRVTITVSAGVGSVSVQ